MTFPYAHRAHVELGEDGDERAIGGAVTTSLCGHWEHAGPCRWPHLTSVRASGRMLEVTVAYTCSDGERAQVESMITRAMASGELTCPDGRVTRWRVVSR